MGCRSCASVVAAHGISLDMVPLPMSSAEISRAELPAIFLGPSPERDRNIDDICQMIRNCARAGIFQVKYNFTLIGIPRSGTAPGRGGARYSEFVFANAKQDPPLTLAGQVDAGRGTTTSSTTARSCGRRTSPAFLTRRGDPSRRFIPLTLKRSCARYEIRPRSFGSMVTDTSISRTNFTPTRTV